MTAAAPQLATRPAAPSAAQQGDWLVQRRAPEPQPGEWLVQRKCACGGTPGPDGECEACRKKRLEHEAAGMQAKLVVGAPGDPLEAEADRAADRVMAMSSAAASPSVTAGCGGDAVQAAPAGPEAPSVSPSSESAIGGLRGGGRPLAAADQRFFGDRFGHDFAHVRVHADTRAAGLARSVGARAFTVGSDLVFGAGEYAPGTAGGRRLIAHELAHTIQQGRGIRRLHRKPLVTGRAAGRIQRQVLVEEPAAGCGICYRMAAIAGSIAHKVIQFEDWVPGGVAEGGKDAEVRIRCGRKVRRPDLVFNPRPGVWVLGSIKPARQKWYDNGRKEYEKYRDCIKRTNPAAVVIPLRVPIPSSIMPFPNPGASEACGSQSFRVNPPDQWGTYGYYCWPTFREIRRRPGCKCWSRKKKEKGKEKEGKEKPKEEKPKEEPKGKEKPKEEPKTPKPAAANVGIGISFLSTGGGAANAGVGISIMSDGYSVGTVSAGIVYDSQGVAIGAVGAGAAMDSMSAGAATAGAGVVDESMGAAAASAGAGKAKGNLTAGAANAGVGTSEDVTGTAVATAGKGTAKNVQGHVRKQKGEGKAEDQQAGSGKPGGEEAAEEQKAEGKEGKDPTGQQGQAQGDGGTGAGQGGTGGQQAGTGGQPGAAGQQPGAAGQQPGGQPGAAGGQQQPGQGQPGGATGRPSVDLNKLLQTPEGNALLAQATEADKKIEQAPSAVRDLLLSITKDMPAQTKPLPNLDWLDQFISATSGLSAAQLEKLKRLKWKPSEKAVSAADMKKQIEDALKSPEPTGTSSDTGKPAGDKSKTPAPPQGDAAGGKPGGGPKAQGQPGGQPAVGGAKKKPGGGEDTGVRDLPKGAPITDRPLAEGEEKAENITQVSVEPLDPRIKKDHGFTMGQETTIKVKYTIPGFGEHPVSVDVRVINLSPLTFLILKEVVMERRDGDGNVVDERHVPEGNKISFAWK